MGDLLAAPRTPGVMSKRRAYSDPGRQRDDFYRTPERATMALLSVEKFNGAIWECAAGDGAIAKVLEREGHTVVSTDLVNRGWGLSGIDFLMERSRLAPNIVTNPPFKLGDEFVLHALRLGAEKTVIFQRTTWVEGAERYAKLWSRFPPARIWQFSKRLTLWRGDEIGPDKGGTIAFAWFVWERGVHQQPRLGWLP